MKAGCYRTAEPPVVSVSREQKPAERFAALEGELERTSRLTAAN
jgi:hypothetical protein